MCNDCGRHCLHSIQQRWSKLIERKLNENENNEEWGEDRDRNEWNEPKIQLNGCNEERECEDRWMKSASAIAERQFISLINIQMSSTIEFRASMVFIGFFPAIARIHSATPLDRNKYAQICNKCIVSFSLNALFIKESRKMSHPRNKYFTLSAFWCLETFPRY